MADPELMESWLRALAAELNLEVGDVDVQALLDVARDAAHGVTRPAAPLATFLIGWAAGASGGDPDAVARASAAASKLAIEWESR